jgi:hypothetical protein
MNSVGKIIESELHNNSEDVKFMSDNLQQSMDNTIEVINNAIKPNNINPNNINPNNIINPRLISNNINSNLSSDNLNSTLSSDNIINPRLGSDNIINPRLGSDNVINPKLGSDNVINPRLVSNNINPRLGSNNIINPRLGSYNGINSILKSDNGINSILKSDNVINPRLESDNITKPNDNIRRPTLRTAVRKGSDNQNITPLTDNIINKINTHTTQSSLMSIPDDINVTKTNNHTSPVNKPMKDEMVRNVVPRFGRQNPTVNLKNRLSREEIVSPDNEQNSDGDLTDAPFDARSGDSTNDQRKSVSTPCQERNGAYYCRSNKNVMNGNIDHSPVIDVCSYSNATIFLLQDSNIICEIDDSDHRVKGKNRYKASNNIPLIKITTFNGYLHGVGTDRKLYMLPNNYFPTTTWIWDVVDWAPINITHISSTHNSSHLWIQTTSSGALYSAPNIIVDTISHNNCNIKRVYGRDIDHYMEIDSVKYTAIVHPKGNILSNIYDGALSYYDEVIAIHPSEQKEYRGISIVNWIPYYIHA